MIQKRTRQEYTFCVLQYRSRLRQYTGTAVVRLSLLFFISLVTLLGMTSCAHDKRKHVIEENIKAMQTGNLRYRADEIRALVLDKAKNDNLYRSVVRRVAEYYADNRPFVWISLSGASTRADSLLDILQEHCETFGLRSSLFGIEDIRRDIGVLSSPADVKDINLAAAKVEYALTKAFFIYASGQAFGFANPDNIYNHIEEYNVDSLTTRYRRLCDFGASRPDADFFRKAARMAADGRLSSFIDSIQPKSSLYAMLVDKLKAVGKTDRRLRLKILANMERCRWRASRFSRQMPSETDRYNVTVNIPSFSLRAVKGAETLSMAVGCGTKDHKTPMLTSWITRMDVNPQWIVPKSLAADYAFNKPRMHSMGMFVLDKKRGKLPPESVSFARINDGQQYIVQAGGRKNSLGRIIFRFENAFSVFLHDTSSPWLLQRTYRAVSHGCVRLAKPMDLALFLLDDKDSDKADRLRYSMTVETDGDDGTAVDKKKMIRTIDVKPNVPLTVAYYTFFYDESGGLAEYNDVYEYDDALIEAIQPYVN
ncbi:MAG: L,D-transpeptidase family protein [Prevotella sp.]